MPVSQQEYHEVFKETTRECLHDKLRGLPLENLPKETVTKVIQYLLDGGLIDEVGKKVERTFGRHPPSEAQPKAVSQQTTAVASASGGFTSDAPTVALPTVALPNPTVGAPTGFADPIHTVSGGVETDSENPGITSNLEVSATPLFSTGITLHSMEEEWGLFHQAPASGGFTSDAPAVALPTPAVDSAISFTDAINRNPSGSVQTDTDNPGIASGFEGSATSTVLGDTVSCTVDEDCNWLFCEDQWKY